MPPQSFLWFCRRIRLFGISWLATACLLSLLSGLVQPLRAEIKIVSYLLRDRAVVLDSLVLRKAMYFSFKSTEPVSRLKGAMVEGILSIEDDEAARDTSFLFDEAGGNIAFYLPYEIPDGTYNLKIKITSGKGKVLESFSGDFGRDELRAYFKRGQNFWDFTMPYAHLECRGHGELTYHFKSKKAVKPRSLELSARIMSDNRFPALAELSLNGVELGRFELPSADNKDPKVITWRVDNPEALDGLTIQPGENRLSISIPREINIRGMGIRIYAHKNSPDPAVENAVPIILKATPKEGKAKETVYRIPVWGEDGEHISSKFIIPGPESFTKEVIETEQEPFPLTQADIKNGYVLFQKNFLHYVYPWTIPARDEKIDSLDIRISRNDYEPLAFSIYPVRDLGAVRVSAGDLQGPGGSVISSDNVVIHLAKIMKVRTGGTKYRLIPKMLERTDCACIPLDYTTRFWLTVHADKAVAPGLYRGAIRVEPEKEPALELPLTVEVLPITLEQVPGIAYSMFLSYEFFELDSKDWTDRERETIYRDGVNVFRDYKKHGMTTVATATPFHFQWDRDGNPPMEHFKGLVNGAKEAGFTDPVFWYFAHYVQTAKAFHPGNILTYDPKIHTRRARSLVKTAMRLNRELEGPPVYFMAIDEPRIASRRKIALEMFRAIKKVRGVRNMCSTDIGGKLLDIENNSTQDMKRLAPGEKVRTSDREVWEYKNSVITCLNPGYARYVYGYYTWRQDLDGMNSWGFNTTENSRGDPFEDLDHERSDWILAYPHPGCPLPTPNWEAIREGIDDVRYVYQLEKMIKIKFAEHPGPAAEAEKFLDEVRARCDIDERKMINNFGDWTPEVFNQIRQEVVSWILELRSL